MADDTNALCNNGKNHLQLTLDQPTKYGDDIETGGTFPESDEENFDENGEEKGSEAEEEGEEGEAKEKVSKIPLLYQVEPGCTPLSCYSAILTFIVMTLGVFWLLLISPPKNSVPVPIPESARGPPDYYNSSLIYDWEADEIVAPSAPSPIPAAPSEQSLDGSIPVAEDQSFNERTIPKNVIIKDAAS